MSNNEGQIIEKERGLTSKFLMAASDFGRGFVHNMHQAPFSTPLFLGVSPAFAIAGTLALAGVHGVGPFAGSVNPHTDLVTQGLMLVASLAGSGLTVLNINHPVSTGKTLREHKPTEPAAP